MLKGFKFKLPRIKSNKYYTALIEVNQKTEMNKYLEIIVSSRKLKGFRRLSNYSLIRSYKKNIFQIEFVENKHFENINSQLQFYLEELVKIIRSNTKSNNDIKIKLFSNFKNYFFT